jgi:hypothetical protein
MIIDPISISSLLLLVTLQRCQEYDTPVKVRLLLLSRYLLLSNSALDANYSFRDTCYYPTQLLTPKNWNSPIYEVTPGML